MPKKLNGFDYGVHVCFMEASLVIREMEALTDLKHAREWIRWVLSKAPTRIYTHEKLNYKLPKNFNSLISKEEYASLAVTTVENENCFDKISMVNDA